MDWNLGQSDFSEHDLSNFSYYNEQASVVIRIVGDGRDVSVREVTGKTEWDTWLQDERDTINDKDTRSRCFYVILCSRAAEVFPGQSSPISYLPFGRNTWRELVRLLQVDRSITRVIARQVTHFSSVRRAGNKAHGRDSMVAYSARMSTSLPEDIALSTTYVPSTGHTYSVVYGCSRIQMFAIERRIRTAGNCTGHPLLLAGIFAEMERERLIATADRMVDKFALVSVISENTKWDPNSSEMTDYFNICLKSRNLVDQFRAVKRQLAYFLDEVDVLERELNSRPPPMKDKEDMVGLQHDAEAAEKVDSVPDTGRRIKRRLTDIMVEYDDKIDECKMMAQNLPLAMQTVWNQTARQESITNTRIAKANTIIALETKRESAQMRSIALLTMIYLPMSCVASIFSTSLFNWGATDGESVVSSYIWILVVLSVGLTLVTILAWHCFTNRDKRRESKRQGTLDSIGMADMV